MELKVCTLKDISSVAPMIVNLINYHSKMTNAPKEFWCSAKEGEETFAAWIYKGKVYLCTDNSIEIGFFHPSPLGRSAH